MKKIVALVFGFEVVLGARAATTFTWQPTTGGDMAVEGNWDPSTGLIDGQASAALTISKDQSAPITLSQDLSALGGKHYFSFSGEMKFDTPETTLTLGGDYTYLNGKNHETKFTCGSLILKNGLYIENSENMSLVLDGSDVTADLGKTAHIGSKGRNNSLVIKNGATVTGAGIGVGRDAQDYASTSTSTPSNNYLRVEGERTKLTLSVGLTTGVRENNRIEILDHADVTVDSIVTGMWQYDDAAPAVPHVFDGGRVVRITDGAKVTVNPDGVQDVNNARILVGESSGSNTLEVANGAELICVTNPVYIGNLKGGNMTAKYKLLQRLPDYHFNGNCLRVTDPGTKMRILGHSSTGLMIGRDVADHDQRVEVLNGARLENEGDFWISTGYNNGLYVGQDAYFSHTIYTVQLGISEGSTNAYIVVDGGEFHTDREIRVGNNGSYSRFDVINGGFLESPGIIEVGYAAGCHNEMRISDHGLVKCVDPTTRTLYVGYGAGGSSNRLTVANGGQLMTSNVVFNVSNNATGYGNVFAVTNGGYAEFDIRGTGKSHVVCGSNGKSGTLLIDGGELNASNDTMKASATTSGKGARLIVRNGGVLRMKTTYWADQGTDCDDDVEIENGEVYGSTFRIGGSSNTTDDRLCQMDIAGTNSLIKMSGDLVVAADTALNFSIPAAGYCRPPVQVNALTLGTVKEEGPKMTLKVTVDRRFPGGVVTLAEATSAINLNLGFQADLPSGVRLLQEGDEGYDPLKLQVKIPRKEGLIFYIR